MNSDIVIERWNEKEYGPLTEAAIRKLYTPPENYRVSPFHYPAVTRFRGSMRSAQAYVIQGSCEYRFSGPYDPISLSAGDVARLPEGEYEMEVLDSEELHIVIIWEIPPEYRVGVH